MDKYCTLASPNCRSFILDSKYFVRSRMRTMNSIMALKIIRASNTFMAVDSWDNRKTKYLSSNS